MLWAYFVTTRVIAARNPARWAPPSRCGMLLVKHSIVSWKLSFQDRPNSTRIPACSAGVFRLIGGVNTGTFDRSSHSTKATRPPS